MLFTSYAMLNKTYFALKRNPALSSYNILAHGQDGNRTSILQSLNKTENTIVLGANSFWEGVDVKGTGLTTLIITKLPFQPPTKPITSAKMEYIQSQGKNGFAAYSLPQAILKFRQGCGRLIRSADDWGSIIILDKRLLSKGYGKDFLNSPAPPAHYPQTIERSLPNVAAMDAEKSEIKRKSCVSWKNNFRNTQLFSLSAQHHNQLCKSHTESHHQKHHAHRVHAVPPLFCFFIATRLHNQHAAAAHQNITAHLQPTVDLLPISRARSKTDNHSNQRQHHGSAIKISAV